MIPIRYLLLCWWQVVGIHETGATTQCFIQFCVYIATVLFSVHQLWWRVADNWWINLTNFQASQKYSIFMTMTLDDEPPKNCNLANIRQSELKQKICIKKTYLTMRQGSILYYMLIFIASCYIMITHVVLKRYLLYCEKKCQRWGWLHQLVCMFTLSFKLSWGRCDNGRF